MKILILGAGVTGSAVATALASENNDIVVIDRKPELLSALKNRLDIATVVGNAAHPSVLETAGVHTMDIVIAVTDKDETNMLACQIINTLYTKPKTIARIRAIDYLIHPELFAENGIAIDIIISPEQIVMEAIRNIIEFPGVLHVSEFAGGLIRLFSIKAAAKGFLIGKKIMELSESLANAKIRVVAIFRHGVAIAVNGQSVIEAGDEVFFVAPRDKVRKVLADLHKLEAPMKSIIIAGGGHVGKRLAMALERNHAIKVIEYNLRRVKKIANELHHSSVIYGDCTDESILIDEQIAQTDLFCAVTDNDGANIISAALAKNLGVRKVICLLNNHAHMKLLDGTGVDVIVLPNQETLGSILKHVRKGDVAGVSSLCGGTAEAIEAVAHQSKTAPSVVGSRVDEINLPDGVVLGALIRNNEVIPIHHDTVFEEMDNVVMFALDKKLVKNIEILFQRI